MSAWTLSPKGLSLISFMTQVLLPKGRLEYSKVIKRLYMFSIWCFTGLFLPQRARDHLDTLAAWQNEDLGLRCFLNSLYELKIHFWTCIIQAIAVLMHKPRGWIETIFIFMLEMLRSQSLAPLWYISQSFSVLTTQKVLSSSIYIDSVFNSGRYKWNFNFTTTCNWILKSNMLPVACQRQVVSDTLHKLYTGLYDICDLTTSYSWCYCR